MVQAKGEFTTNNAESTEIFKVFYPILSAKICVQIKTVWLLASARTKEVFIKIKETSYLQQDNYGKIHVRVYKTVYAFLDVEQGFFYR
jgi:hypothetical protein